MTIMKRTTQTKTAQTKAAQTTSGELGQSLTFAATHSVKSVCRKFHTTPDGLAIDIAQAKYDLDGPNVITGAAEDPFIVRLLKSFASPFTFILIALAGISYVTNVVLATDGEKDPSTVIIITAMVLISGIIDFVQSSKGASAAAALSKMSRTLAKISTRTQAKVQMNSRTLKMNTLQMKPRANPRTPPTKPKLLKSPNLLPRWEKKYPLNR